LAIVTAASRGLERRGGRRAERLRDARALPLFADGQGEVSMRVTGESLRDGKEFCFIGKPGNAAAANFVAITDDEVIVTRRATDLFALPDEVPVIANWHGEWRTDAFLLTIGDLRAKAQEFGR
jgi:hypothetical protein